MKIDDGERLSINEAYGLYLAGRRDFSDMSLFGSVMSNMSNFVEFDSCYFSRVKLMGVVARVKFVDCNFDQAVFSQLDFVDCEFNSCSMRKAVFNCVSAGPDISFEEVDLYRASMDRVTLEGIDLYGAQLDRVKIDVPLQCRIPVFPQLHWLCIGYLAKVVHWGVSLKSGLMLEVLLASNCSSELKSYYSSSTLAQLIFWQSVQWIPDMDGDHDYFQNDLCDNAWK